MISADDISVGDEPAPFTDAPLSVTDFVRYQGASGDMNPIHHDTEFARRAGFDQPFAVGMFTAGVLATYVTDWLGPANVRRFKVQFREQAWPGDELTYSGRVVNKEATDQGCVVSLELLVTRATGGTHLKGWATFALPSAARSSGAPETHQETA